MTHGIRFSMAITGAVLLTVAGATTVSGQSDAGSGGKGQAADLVGLAPYRGYLDAHRRVTRPPALLGGPLDVRITQDQGGVFVALPDHRELDEHVFGTPEHPRAFGGTPVINGLPPAVRRAEGGQYTTAAPLSPFGNKHVTMPEGRLSVHLVDRTAVDAARTEDRVEFRASWRDGDGNAYEVRCCRMLAAHGVEFPTFGGVVTNHVLHGSSRIGTALMPTEFVYAAFWGMGSVLRNGEVVAESRLIHGMLTEYVRGEGYQLVADAGVTPTRTHFHLMVPPMMPQMDAGRFVQNPVPTGFTLPNGRELPFWHVMFENLTVQATRGGDDG